jgi:hypothetical protein
MLVVCEIGRICLEAQASGEVRFSGIEAFTDEQTSIARSGKAGIVQGLRHQMLEISRKESEIKIELKAQIYSLCRQI